MRLGPSSAALRSFLVLPFLIAAFGASTAHAAGVVSVCDQAHLQAALAGGGLVTFSCSGDIALTSTITISANTSIDGTGQSVTLDGKNTVVVLTVNVGVTLVLNNLTVANGSSAGAAGAITNSGALLITNSTFSGNTDSAGGGAGAIVNNGTLFITNSTFSANSDNVDGSAGAIWNNGNAVLTSDTFSANSNDPQAGAAFVNFGPATVTNSTFSGNTGGAIENTSTLTVVNSTFSGNTLMNPMGGSYEGAAIFMSGGTTTLENTILVHSDIDNCASTKGPIVDGGYNLDDDGTCGLSSANHSLSNEPYADLYPLASNGGLTQTFALQSDSVAIAKIPPGVNGCATTVPNDQRGVSRPQSADGYCSMGAYEAYNTITALITDCSDDTELRAAMGNGGRIVFYCDGTIPLTNTLANSQSSLLDANGHNVSISGGNTYQALLNTSNTVLILHGLTIENGSGDDEGGGVQNAGTLIITDSTFVNNFATSDYGGGILHAGDLLIVTNSTFSGNSGTNGSAIYANTNGPIILTGSTFSGNTITALIGVGNSVIYANETPVYLQNTLIAGNALHGGSECLIPNGSVTDLGYNLDDDGTCRLSSANHSLSNNQNASPGSLSSNGGSTQTVPLTYPSSTIDAIPITASACGVSPDQRAVLRPQGPACDIGAFEAIEIPVPFATNPANLAYEVGTTPYNSAKSPFLVVAGEYPLSTTSPQSGGAGTQYVWENWSDNGGIDHTITIPPTPVSFTATFGTQYYLTMNVNPSNAGTVSPGSSWQDATAVVDISASPSSGFQFSSWTGSTVANASSASTTITMSGPETVTANFAEPPSITSANNTTFSVGTPGTFTVTTMGYPTVTSISDGSATLPRNITFHNNGDGTATLSGTPKPGTGGAYTFTITASNNVSPNATQQFTLYIDQPPAITSAKKVTFTAGTFATFTVTSTGYPAPSLSDGGFSLPSGLTFHDNGNGTAALAGTPASNTGGIYTFTITASNGVSPNATQSFTLTIDQSPAVTSPSNITFYLGVPSSFTVTVTGYPTPRLTSSKSLPSGVFFIDNGNGTGTIYGTPTVAGTFPVTITATNSVGHATQDFTLYVDASIGISPTSLNFGTVVLNSKHSLTAVLTNTSASAITITGVSIVPGTANATTYVYAGNCVGKLMAGASCNLTVNFTANATGSLTATLDVTDSVPGSPQTIPLTASVSP